MTATTDGPLLKLLVAIGADDQAAVAKMIAAPGLETAAFREGATRQDAQTDFIGGIGRYVFGALPWAVRTLLECGADGETSEQERDQRR